MSACPACRADLPARARFCPACGTRLEDDRPEATERKVVTTLFADLVGFTALGERHDPEDVDAALRGYYALARTIIERFGGSVEKFIGDAVVGLFGVPAAHEDDAERAVRAALELVAHLPELPSIGEEQLQVRCAVNTGRALVRLNARPEAGEGVLVGDAVNTCARLLADAPAMGVVVGEMTQRLSSRVIAYEKLPAMAAKGKATPVPRWLARGPISKRGVDLRHAYGAALVGREVELGILKGMLAQVASSRLPRLALLIGEAGVGKTRLAFELARWIDREPGLMTTWRQGRCLPYGEGSGFQPLAEVVRLQCGIANRDDEATVAAKIDRAVGDAPEHAWISERLRALLGFAAAHAEQDENFSAWGRFLELVANERPTVVFLDDLHWADEALLQFLDHALHGGCKAPLLVLAGARPDLLELHPEFERHLGDLTQGDVPGVRINLASLSPNDAERLIAELSPDVRDDTTSVIVERSGGNPFYVEELVRLFNEREQLDGAGWIGFDSLPDSIQALLTSRLDSLDAGHKSVLADAAVAGQQFSIDLVAAMGIRDVSDVRRILSDLAAREFVRPAGGEAPLDHFVFWHAMTRDAAYAQLPRAARAGKHIAAARWLEGPGEIGSPQDEAATAVAYHYVTALDLFTDMGDEVQTTALRSPTAAALGRAGDAVLPLDVRAAHSYYARGCSLARQDATLRPRLTVALAESSIRLGHLDEAMRQLESGISELEAAGERRGAAVALTRLSNVVYWLNMGGAGAAARLREQALELLEGDEPSPELVTVLEERAVQCSRDLQPEPSIRFANEAIAMSERLGLPLPLRALAYRGASRSDAGEASGIADIRKAHEAAVRRGEVLVADSSAQLLADGVYATAGPAAGLRVALEALTDATRRGEHLAKIWFQMQAVQFYRLSGRWDEALSEAQPLETHLKERGSLSPLHDVRWDIAQIRFHQGDLEEAERLLDWCETQFPFHPFVRLQDLGARIAFCSYTEDFEGALRALREYEELSRGRRYATPVSMTLPQVTRAAVRCSAGDTGATIVAGLARPRLLERAVTVAFQGLTDQQTGRLPAAVKRFAEAASLWREFGDPFEEALSGADRGRCLLAMDRPADAADALTDARAILVRLGANPALAEVDRSLEACDVPRRV
jgi:class 3 adenylate cyclase/tetratricopeptide (TPR) repeat protein/DNA polymerase III delta prime subunit